MVYYDGGSVCQKQRSQAIPILLQLSPYDLLFQSFSLYAARYISGLRIALDFFSWKLVSKRYKISCTSRLCPSRPMALTRYCSQYLTMHASPFARTLKNLLTCSAVTKLISSDLLSLPRTYVKMFLEQRQKIRSSWLQSKERNFSKMKNILNFILRQGEEDFNEHSYSALSVQQYSEYSKLMKFYLHSFSVLYRCIRQCLSQVFIDIFSGDCIFLEDDSPCLISTCMRYSQILSVVLMSLLYLQRTNFYKLIASFSDDYLAQSSDWVAKVITFGLLSLNSWAILGQRLRALLILCKMEQLILCLPYTRLPPDRNLYKEREFYLFQALSLE